MAQTHDTRRPKRMPWGRWRGRPIARLPHDVVADYAASLHGPLREAFLGELRLRAGADRDPDGELLLALEWLR
jgi:hypothetical protein